MALCRACNGEMLTADDCPANRIIEYADGVKLPATTYHFSEPSGRCHDCGIKHGNYHHFGCDVERCPRCGDQLISCDCLFADDDDDD